MAVLLLAGLWLPAVADTPLRPAKAGDADAGARPRIALVLGGGGAKGGAHIGVLRALDELRIPIDCVAGTSMGALVGATFAAGLPPDEIERRVLAIDWSATVGTAGKRDLQPIQRKLRAATYTNDLRLGIRNGRLALPGGLLSSQSIEELLRQLVAGARAIDDFDELPVPFRAVATDMLSGEMVVLGDGDLALAMRASMAVPGAFAPVTLGSRLLADGGQVRNLPVDVGRALCGDVVIAAWIATPVPDPEELKTAVGMLSRSLDVMIDANTHAQLATLGPRDVAIRIDPGDVTASDFDRVPEMIPAGRAATLAQARQLQRYALPERAYRAWRARINRSGAQPIRPAALRITGTQRVSADYLRSQLVETRVGEPVSPEQIARDSERLYAVADFERVTWRLAGEPDEPAVEFHVQEREDGPDFFSFDFGLGGSAGGDLGFALRAEHERAWLNRRGGAWRNTAELGSRSQLRSRLNQPLDSRQRVYVESGLLAEQRIEDNYLAGRRAGEYRLQDLRWDLAGGLNLGRRAQLQAGVRLGWTRADLRSGPADFPEFGWRRESALAARAVYDTRDDIAVPTGGSLILLRYLDAGEWLDGEQDYSLGEALLFHAFSRGGTTGYMSAAGGKAFRGRLPVNRGFRLGGMRSFPGLERFERRGRAYWLVAAGINRKLLDIEPVFGQALYAGLRLTAAELNDAFDGRSQGTLYGAAVNLGGRTPIGPFALSLGATDQGDWQFQFGLGRPLDEGGIWDELR